MADTERVDDDGTHYWNIKTLPKNLCLMSFLPPPGPSDESFVVNFFRIKLQ